MYLIVVGAGPEGASFVDLAVQDGHEVTLVEVDDDKAQTILQRHNIKVLRADLLTDGILEDVHIDRADALVATTTSDVANLMAMAIAKEHGIETRISMINERAHRQLFERLGVKILMAPEVIIAKQLYSFVPSQHYPIAI